MKLKPLSLLVLAALGTPLAAQAEGSPFSFNIGATSDYIFRGVTQTQHNPAIQGGIDYTHASGFSLGTWASNVDWVDEGHYKDNSFLELDLYGGYRGSLGPIGYDLGVIEYYYPGDSISGTASPDTTELYVSGSWEFLSLKYSHAVSSHFIGWVGSNGEDTRNSKYLELNANYDLGKGWGVLGHLGHQWVNNLNSANYTDWKVGVTKDVGFGVVTLAYSDTSANDNWYTISGEKIANGRASVSFLKTF
jgi:uncharacterized protein (TIGR02001 family)